VASHYSRAMIRGLGIAVVVVLASTAHAQLDGSIVPLEHPAIGYRTEAPRNSVAELQERRAKGTVDLPFDPRPGVGYLPAALEALRVPVESQLLVYSKTSLQQRAISPDRPRALYFNDELAVGAVHGGFIEIAVQDPRQGAVFYSLEQVAGKPMIQRQGTCLGCHYSLATLGVPGFFTRSIPSAADGQTLPWLGNATVTHSTPLEERWGGWYVTGEGGTQPHLGNLLLEDPRATVLPPLAPALPEALNGRFVLDYLTPYSDAVAHLVFDHQLEMMNVLTRVGWEFRIAAREGREPVTLDRTIEDAVDYLLFVGEANLEPIGGTSGFAEKFAALGPMDERGRSLRELRLDGRLMRYPLSYLIYSRAFDALPDEAQAALYRRLWSVLSGVADERYAHLSPADRTAIVEILVATKPGLPDYFR
jgi:hypothetical protein